MFNSQVYNSPTLSLLGHCHPDNSEDLQTSLLLLLVSYYILKASRRPQAVRLRVERRCVARYFGHHRRLQDLPPLKSHNLPWN